MSDLDDKIFKILIGGTEGMALDSLQLAWKRKQPQIEQIKKLFIESGYKQYLETQKSYQDRQHKSLIRTGNKKT